MSKQSETGHAKNVENFKKLNEHIVSFGPKYAPSDVRLQIPNVSTVSQAGSASLILLSEAQPPYLQAISRREAAFDNVAKLASRALTMAETLHLSPTTIKALKELVRKLYGRRATPKKVIPLTDAETTEPEHKTISVSQLSFDQRIAHFAQFIDILKAEPTYQPSESELSTIGLSARLADMRMSNDSVTQFAIPVTNARNHRNTILYASLTGLVDVAMDIKKYVRAAFGDNSDEFREIKGLHFKKP
jgi:hypothetical protein